MNRTARIVVIISLTALTIGGCASSTDDAPAAPPPPGSTIIPSPLQGWQAEVWTFCDHGHRLYEAAFGQGPALAIVPNDPSCAP